MSSVSQDVPRTKGTPIMFYNDKNIKFCQKIFIKSTQANFFQILEHFATDCTNSTSLSPRPERFTKIVSSGLFIANYLAYAMACALSSAGIIPSVLDNS